jgi:molecular chaperone DnaJ
MGGGQTHGFGNDFASSFSDIFEGPVRHGPALARRRWPRARRGPALQHGDHARGSILGKTAQVSLPTAVTCESCSGTGAKAGTKPKTCAACGGAGRVRQSQGFFTIERTCPMSVRAAARPSRTPAASCSGSGRVMRERTLQVNIPAGVEDGTRIRLAGEGEAGRAGGPPAISTFSCR